MILASGKFKSCSDRMLIGGFMIKLGDNGLSLETLDDFYFSGAPAPGWALFKGKLRKDDPLTETAAMAFRIGPIVRPSAPPYTTVSKRNSFPIPDRIKISKFDGVMAWCYGTPEIIGIGYFSRS